MGIREQVNALRKLAEERVNSRLVYDAMLQAADTIESLSAKVQAANMERNEILKEIREKARELSDNHWGDDERHLIGKGIQCMCVQAENIIKANMERSAEDFGGWISCSEPPKHANEVLIFNGKSYSVGYYDGKTWVNAIHPVEWQEIRHEP